jgi:hypothetical protein
VSACRFWVEKTGWCGAGGEVAGCVCGSGLVVGAAVGSGCGVVEVPLVPGFDWLAAA